MPLSPKDALIDAVNDVKNLKPAEIAAVLKKRKILGRPGTTGRCPLALLMSGAHGGRFIVGQKYVMHQTRGGQVEQVKTPTNLAAFVRMFDSGQFKDLIQVPPRCLPSDGRKDKPKGPNSVTAKPIRRRRGAERLHLARDVQRFKRVTGGKA